MSDVATLTLTDFLLARIAEDEAVAREAAGFEDSARSWNVHFAGDRIEPDVAPTIWPFAAGHVARHDPARVLAECEAKRRIVERCRPLYAIAYRESDRLLADAFEQTRVPVKGVSDPLWPFDGAEDILRALASVYADHHDYAEVIRS